MSVTHPTAKPQGQPQPDLRAERPQDGARVGVLVEQAFGPGRLAKAAERLRETNEPLLDISLVAWAGETAVGCVRMWPVHIGETEAVLLGPFAVEDAWRSRGLGAQLIAEACEAAAGAGHGLILLVGDGAYFTKLGFEPAPAGRVTLPGPVNPRRLFWRALKPGAHEGVAGAVTPG